jgi:hypothetical protein
VEGKAQEISALEGQIADEADEPEKKKLQVRLRESGRGRAQES